MANDDQGYSQYLLQQKAQQGLPVVDQFGFHSDRLIPYLRNMMTGAAHGIVQSPLGGAVASPDEKAELEGYYQNPYGTDAGQVAGTSAGEAIGGAMQPESVMAGAIGGEALGMGLNAAKTALNPIARSAFRAAAGPASNVGGQAATKGLGQLGDDFFVWRPGANEPPIRPDYAGAYPGPKVDPLPSQGNPALDDFKAKADAYVQALMTQGRESLDRVFEKPLTQNPRALLPSMTETSNLTYDLGGMPRSLKQNEFDNANKAWALKMKGIGGAPGTPYPQTLPRGETPIATPYDPSMNLKELPEVNTPFNNYSPRTGMPLPDQVSPYTGTKEGDAGWRDWITNSKILNQKHGWPQFGAHQKNPTFNLPSEMPGGPSPTTPSGPGGKVLPFQKSDWRGRSISQGSGELETRDLGRNPGTITPDFQPQVRNALGGAESDVNLQAAFMDRSTGHVYRTGPFHDVDAANHLGMGKDFEEGFALPDGRFFTRQQANKLMGSP